jgi:hypothetical protein
MSLKLEKAKPDFEHACAGGVGIRRTIRRKCFGVRDGQHHDDKASDQKSQKRPISASPSHMHNAAY